MKFLLVMFIIGFLFSLLDNKQNKYDEEEEINDNGRVIHPAESPIG